jgi:hypothetical protein
MNVLLDIFEKAKAHLLAQGQRSEDEHNNCLYRGPNGTKCVIGYFIPDKYYSSKLEGKNVYSVEIQEVLRLSGIDVDNKEILSLLGRLQTVHDITPPSRWPRMLDHMKQSGPWRMT